MDWTKAQKKLGVIPDNIAGPKTYTALFEYAAGRLLGDIGVKLGASAAKNFAAYGMNTPERVSEFVAQIANETGGFRVWEENLNYSQASMLKTWPRHFNQALALWAKGNPMRVAEVAYGVRSRTGSGRMGNVAPGDGWDYRGRGALQLTGKDNYRRFGKLLGLDLVIHPDIAADPEISLLIALMFFKLGNVNAAVDKRDYIEARRITNGGAIGLTHVAAYRNKLLALWK